MDKQKYDYALTTIDNPYDPLDDFDNWFTYDNDMGYGTNGLLDRYAQVTELMTEDQYGQEIERAIRFIVENDPFGLYKMVKKPKD